MSRIFIVINLTGFVFYFVGCKNIATESSSPTRKPGNSILWEISSESSPLKSFLYGTIHIQDKRVFSFDAIVQNSFQNADILRKIWNNKKWYQILKITGNDANE